MTFAAAASWFATVAPASARPPAGSWEVIPPAAWQEAARPDSGGLDAIILAQRAEHWDLQGEFRYTLFRRIRVFTPEGRDAGKVELPYDKDDRIERIRAHSVRQDGATTELSPDQIVHTIIAKRGGAEWNMASFIVPGIEPGCIVEYEFTISGKYRGSWNRTAYLQSDFYTLDQIYQWHPSEWIVGRTTPAQWALRKILPFQVAIEATPNAVTPRTVTFRTHCVPGFKAEPFAPPLADAGARVDTFYGRGAATAVSSWSFAKRAMAEIGKAYEDDLGPLEAVVRRARERASDPMQALAIVHGWLRTHVRPIHELSWEERQNGRRRPRIEVLEVRFDDARGWPIVVGQWVVGPVKKDSPITSLIEHGWGTPYEINAAFVAAAHRLGLQACVAFVGDRRDAPFDGDIGSAWPSNVVSALRTPGSRWGFYDPASAFSPFGSTPWYLRGGVALLGGAGNELFVVVEPEDGLPARTQWQLDLVLDDEGDLDGSVTGKLFAEAARDAKAWLWAENPDRWNERLQEEHARDGVPKLEFETPRLATDPDSAFVLAAHARYAGYAPSVGGIMSVPLERLIPWRFRAEFVGAQRSQPLFFQNVRDQTIDVSIRLPTGATATDLPASREYVNGLGTFRTSWVRTDEGVRFQRTVQIKFAEIDRRDYGVVREFFDALEVADHDVLRVKRS